MGKIIFEQSNQLKEYEGEWEDDRMHGKGSANYKNGDKYVGEFKNNEVNGVGRYIWRENNPNLTKQYYGNFTEGKKHGFGTLEYTHGDFY